MHKVTITASNGIYAAWGALVSFTQDINTALIGMLICMALDTITGFIAAPYRGQRRQSSKLSKVVGKIITYCIAIISIHTLEQLILPTYISGTLQLGRMACTLFAGLEVYSIFENLRDITGLKAFEYLTQLSFKKIKETTGIDVEKGKGNNGRAEKTQKES